jgi:hypothetical protein
VGRLDYKRGRFNPDYETDKILSALAGWQSVDGDWADYYRFDPVHSEIDEVYDEPTGNGLAYFPPVRVEATHVEHVEGANEDSENGFYYNDDAALIVAFDKVMQAGMDYADIMTGNYLKDRIVYDRKVFRVRQISIRGQMQRRDIIVAISATQVKPDEMVWDVQFADWAPDGAYTTNGPPNTFGGGTQ